MPDLDADYQPTAGMHYLDVKRDMVRNVPENNTYERMWNLFESYCHHRDNNYYDYKMFIDAGLLQLAAESLGHVAFYDKLARAIYYSVLKED